jgi:hypothetical protein
VTLAIGRMIQRGKLCHQRAQRRRDQRDRGDGSADAAEAFANQIAKAAIAIYADPDGEILHEDQNRNQQQQHRRETKPPHRTRLSRGDDIACVGIGQHHQYARAPDGGDGGDR